MSNSGTALQKPRASLSNILLQILRSLSMPLLAVATAFLLGGLVIWATSGSLLSVFQAYQGLFAGALFKQRGLSESLVATTPYIFLSLAVAIGF